MTRSASSRRAREGASELVNPPKTLTAVIDAGAGGETGYRYAPLSAGLTIVRKTLGRHELAIVQTTDLDPASGRGSDDDAGARVRRMDRHRGRCARRDITNPKLMGAALTYARRYSLFALVGLAGEDDLDAPELKRPASRGRGWPRRRQRRSVPRPALATPPLLASIPARFSPSRGRVSAFAARGRASRAPPRSRRPARGARPHRQRGRARALGDRRPAPSQRPGRRAPRGIGPGVSRSRGGHRRQPRPDPRLCGGRTLR